MAAIVLANGEVTSNLRLTQAIYDGLMARGAIAPAQPIDPTIALDVMREVLPGLIAESHVAATIFMGNELTDAVDELPFRFGNDDSGLRTIVRQAQQDSEAYYRKYVKKGDKGDKGSK